jgi:hypothetical protein
VEIAALLLALISTIASVWAAFAKTDRLLTEIRDVLIQIREQRR